MSIPLSNPFNRLAQVAGDIGSAAIRNHLKQYVPNTRFQALQEAANGPILSNIPGVQDIIQQFAATNDPRLQESLTHAIINNPNFLDYVRGPGGDNIEPSKFAELIEANEHAPKLMADIFNSIGNNPDYDFEKLDTIFETFEKYDTGKRNIDAAQATLEYSQQALEDLRKNPHTPEELKEHKDAVNDANKALVTAEKALKDKEQQLFLAIQDAGGNLPALTGTDLQTFLYFMQDLAQNGGPIAMANLIDTLGLEGAEADALRETLGPIANMLDGIMNMGEPSHRDFMLAYLPAGQNFVRRMSNNFEILTRGSEVAPNYDSNGRPFEQASATADMEMLSPVQTAKASLSGSAIVSPEIASIQSAFASASTALPGARIGGVTVTPDASHADNDDLGADNDRVVQTSTLTQQGLGLG